MGTIAKTDSVRFTTKGQVVIPAWLRREFQIEEGTKAELVTGDPEFKPLEGEIKIHWLK